MGGRGHIGIGSHITFHVWQKACVPEALFQPCVLEGEQPLRGVKNEIVILKNDKAFLKLCEIGSGLS